MAKRSRSSAPTEAKPETVAVETKAETVKLRLKQNDFIGGVYAKKGTTINLSRQEATRRLARETKWEIAS